MNIKVKLIYTLVFLVTISLHILSVAPGITLEDSGELSTALHFYGIPHPPGYPLYVLLGGLFVNLSATHGALMANLFSVLLASISSVVILYFYINFSSGYLNIKRTTSSYVIAAISVLAIIFAPHVFRQSIIAEVYSLQLLLVTLSLIFFTKYLTEKKKINLNLFLIFSGLCFSNHHIYLPLFLALISILFFNKSFFRIKNIFTSILFFSLGISVNFFTLFRAKESPVLNWGEPDSIYALFHTLTRAQYAPHIHRTWDQLIEQLREQGIHIFYNIPIYFLFPAIFFLVLSYIEKRKLFYLLSIMLIATGPIAVSMVNFKIPTEANYLYLEISNLISVFFTTHYLIWGLIIFLSFQFLNHKTKLYLKYSSYFVALLMFAGTINVVITSLKKEDKSKYNFASELVYNYQVAAENKKSLVFTNWDPFTFPSFYYQLVENKYKDLYVVDLELLKGPWYIKSVVKWYPNLMGVFKNHDAEYIKQFKRVLSNEAKWGDVCAIPYQGMIRSLLDYAEKNDYKILIANLQEVMPLPFFPWEEYKLISKVSAIEAVRTEKTTSVDINFLDRLNFKSFQILHESHQHDRMAKMLASYYLRNLILFLEDNPYAHDIRLKAANLANDVSKIDPKSSETLSAYLKNFPSLHN